MKLKDKVFKDGVLVKLREGNGVILNEKIVTNDNRKIAMSRYDNNLIHISFDEFDIMKAAYGEEIIYEREEEVDWNKVPMNTKVLVRNYNDDEWKERYFCCYIPEESYGYIFACFQGKGNTNLEARGIIYWKHCKLAE